MNKDPLDVDGLLDLVQNLTNKSNLGGSAQSISEKRELLSEVLNFAKAHLDPKQQEAVADLVRSLVQESQEKDRSS